MRSAPRQTDSNAVIRAASMPMGMNMQDTGDAQGPFADWNQLAAGGLGGSGVSYAPPKLGTQSYSAGTLTGKRN